MQDLDRLEQNIEIIVEKSKKAQSAVEFLSIYGFAIILIIAVAGIAYFFITKSQSLAPTQCDFSGYLNCKVMLLGANSVTTRAVLLLSNEQQYSIQNPSITLNITGSGTYAGTCKPNYARQGADIECVVNINKQITTSQLSTGNISVSLSVCTQITQGKCSSPIAQTYSGTFTTFVNSQPPVPQCGMTITAINTSQSATLTILDPVTANVKLSGYKINGAAVNFTSNTLNAGVSPEYTTTDSNGNAITYVSSGVSSTTANIVATFSNCTASKILTFH